MIRMPHYRLASMTDTLAGMPTFSNHPIRMLRIERDLTAKQLSELAGVHRSTVQAIEEGRTQSPGADTVADLARALRVDAAVLQQRLMLWEEEQRPSVEFSARALATLGLEPVDVGGKFTSFVQWRSNIAPSPTAFASMLGVNRKVVADYEAGLKKRGMPLSMGNAMLRRLKLSTEYLIAVEALPVGGEDL